MQARTFKKHLQIKKISKRLDIYFNCCIFPHVKPKIMKIYRKPIILIQDGFGSSAFTPPQQQFSSWNIPEEFKDFMTRAPWLSVCSSGIPKLPVKVLLPKMSKIEIISTSEFVSFKFQQKFPELCHLYCISIYVI